MSPDKSSYSFIYLPSIAIIIINIDILTIQTSFLAVSAVQSTHLSTFRCARGSHIVEKKKLIMLVMVVVWTSSTSLIVDTFTISIKWKEKQAKKYVATEIFHFYDQYLNNYVYKRYVKNVKKINCRTKKTFIKIFVSQLRTVLL